MPLCCECAQERPRSAFSKLQLRKPADNRKCRSCVDEASAALIECSLCKTKGEPTEFDKENQQANKKKPVCGSCASSIMKPAEKKTAHEENDEEDPRVQEIVDYLSSEVLVGFEISNSPLLHHDIKVFLKDLDEEETTSIFKASRTYEEFKRRSMRYEDEFVSRGQECPCMHKIAIHRAGEAMVKAVESLNVQLNARATMHFHREVVNYDMLCFLYSSVAEMILIGGKLDTARHIARAALLLQMYLIKDTSALFAVQLPEEMFPSYPGFVKEFLAYSCHIESDHGLVKFLAKRVPCKCLEEIKKEMKVSGQDICDNCGQSAPVRKLKECKQCHLGKYCSRDCQVVDWVDHKQMCQRIAGKKKKSS